MVGLRIVLLVDVVGAGRNLRIDRVLYTRVVAKLYKGLIAGR